MRTLVTLVVVLSALFVVPAGARVRPAFDMLPDADTPPTVLSVGFGSSIGVDGQPARSAHSAAAAKILK